MSREPRRFIVFLYEDEMRGGRGFYICFEDIHLNEEQNKKRQEETDKHKIKETDVEILREAETERDTTGDR